MIIVVQIASSAIHSGGLGIELMRSINLFHHYLEHRDENANLTFAHFLYDHYLTEHFEETSEPIDHDLPFQSSIHWHVSLGLYITPLPTSAPCASWESALEVPIIQNEDSPSSNYGLTFWMPPRM